MAADCGRFGSSHSLLAFVHAIVLCSSLWRYLEEYRKIEKNLTKEDMQTQQGLPKNVPDDVPSVPVVPVVPLVNPDELPPVPDSPSGPAESRSHYGR